MIWLQKAAGEPWLWSITPGELGPYLEACGWNSDSNQLDAAQKYGVEYFAMAAKPENGK